MLTHRGSELLLKLGEECILSSIVEIYEKLAFLPSMGLPMHIDLAGITDIDFCGIQVLLSLKKEFRNKNLPLHFESPSVICLKALEQLGLKSDFEEGSPHGQA